MNEVQIEDIYDDVLTTGAPLAGTSSNKPIRSDLYSIQIADTEADNSPIKSPLADSKHTAASSEINFNDERSFNPQSSAVYYDEQISQTPTGFEKAGFFDRLHYIFLIKEILRIRKINPSAPLKPEDFPALGRTEEANHKILDLERRYIEYRQKHKRGSLVIPVLKMYWRQFLFIQVCFTVSLFSKLLFNTFLGNLLRNIEQSQKFEAYQWAAGLCAIMLLAVYTHSQAFFVLNKCTSQLKPAVLGTIHRKISRLNFFSINRLSIGKIVNIASNDLNILDGNFWTMFQFSLAPFIFIAALIMLWRMFHIHSLPGIIFVILIWPYQGCLGNMSAKLVDKKNDATDERIKATNEVIEGVRLIKMYSWELKFTDLIKALRHKELSILKKIEYIEQFATHMLSKIAPSLGSFVIFLSYGLSGNQITLDKVYSTIVLLTYLGNNTIYATSWGIKFIIEIRLTMKRIMEILDLEELDTNTYFAHEAPLDPANGVEFDDFSAYWGERAKTDEESPVEKDSENGKESVQMTYQRPTLKNLSFTVKKGTLCAIVGKIGSGKSTALMTFFKEVPKTTGDLRFEGRLAYVEQEIVIFPGTIRSNILFGREYDEKTYNEVVKVCCLLDDFKEFPSRDLMEIGERGINLSGGQKARISLARALYSDADIYLLDDPLSAVDAKVAKNLFQNAIRGFLKGKTVILVTHQVHFAREAEKIVVFDEGTVKAEGTLDEIMKRDSSIVAIFETTHDNKKEDEVEEEEESESIETPENDSPKRNGKINRLENNDRLISVEDNGEQEEIKKASAAEIEKGQLTSAEDETAVRWSVIWYYIKSVRSFLLIGVLLLSSAGIETLNIVYTRLLGHWATGEWDLTHAMWVLVPILLVFLGCLITREIQFVNVTLNASEAIHNNALRKMMTSVVEFFDTNPVGRILNRFSNDTGILDRQLLWIIGDLLDAVFYFGSIFITVWMIVPWMIIPGMGLLLFCVQLLKFHKRVILEGRANELKEKSPIYSLFSTTLAGLLPIRVYAQQQKFIYDFTRLLNRHCRCFIGYWNFCRVFAFYCDYFTTLFGCTGIAIMLALDIDPTLLGLACTLLLSMSDYFQWALRQTLMFVLMMSSTARVKAFAELPQEAALTLPRDQNLIQNHSWPSKGVINFDNVHMKYRKNTDHVLKGLTFSVKGGEKIGCVGRTGAGKSSIIQALFRMVEIDRASVPNSSIIIDGQDTLELGLHTIRQNISIIPQAPFIFKGSVRRNLDPMERYSDEQIYKALEETDLLRYVNSLPDGLNTDISNASSVFSVGQKQLVCLARVLLQNNKIIVLDEATANVDFETDNFIQKKIMERFKNCTVFTIAHRLSTVANYSKVLVMDKGRAIEFDHPYLLLVKKPGDNTITNTEGVFASMVLHTGAKHSAVIFEIAQKSYYSNEETSSGSP